jgi:hypothetical protein
VRGEGLFGGGETLHEVATGGCDFEHCAEIAGTGTAEDLVIGRRAIPVVPSPGGPIAVVTSQPLRPPTRIPPWRFCVISASEREALAGAEPADGHRGRRPVRRGGKEGTNGVRGEVRRRVDPGGSRRRGSRLLRCRPV